ncbi:GAF domain-containing sensor histidine kinase [Actinomyces timonensis]|uniref:GAF domain-containing sensor histidine kinase n=1 Tax=Actinomyces timonensis TaxID=1288391 RepID=UPI0003006929|nr:GAF domain-containing protein [Actinomyces timonensis]
MPEHEEALDPRGRGPGGPLAYAVHAHQEGAAGPQGGEPSWERAVDVVQAALRLTSSLRVTEALRRLVDSACSITGAEWGTIAVSKDAVVEPEAAAPPSTGNVPTLIGDQPEILQRVLGEAPASGAPDAPGLVDGRPEEGIPQGVVVVNDLSGATAFTGAIEGEESGSMLSVPVRAHGRLFGRLYLGDRPGGFGRTEIDAVVTLAEAAAIAVENARLYRQARDREQWMALSQEITTLLLSGAEQDDALGLIARRVREVAHAGTSALVLPSVGETWICEIADGNHADRLIGTYFPPEGRAMSTLTRRTGLTVPSLIEAWGAEDLKVEALARFGPALYAPMIHRDRGVGVMLLLREPGEAPFTQQDLEIAELVAGQATMAFELADAQHAEEMATLLDERARIGRDLHDLAIQQLFATGMQVTAARDRLGKADIDCDAMRAVLDSVLSAVDDSVSQIRSIVHSLRDRDEEVGLVERLRCEASLARTSLGFAPSLLITVDGRALTEEGGDAYGELSGAIAAAVDDDVADDMVAVVREGLSNVARHARASSATIHVRVNGVLPAGERVEENWAGTTYPLVAIACRDDGVGVDPAVTRRSGTANMAERARRHGGSFSIGPRARSDGPRRGTIFTWIAPLDRS